MTFSPRNPGDIFADLREDLKNRIGGLTNFIDGTFAEVFLQSYSEQLSEAEYKALAAQLAMFVDFAGRNDITRTELSELGITADPDRLNEYMRRRQLDELGKLVAVSRETGSRSRGTVEFTVTDSSVEIPEGTEVATEPSRQGAGVSFFVDVDGDGIISPTTDVTASPDSGTTVEVDVIAARTGSEFNVGAGTLTFIPTPQPGLESVTNLQATTGGDDAQSDALFREDIKSALVESTGGGTAKGIKGFIDRELDSVRDVQTIENTDVSPPNVEVVVDGGPDTAVIEAIENSRPVGIRHELVRPDIVNIGMGIEVETNGASVSSITEAFTRFVDATGLGDAFSRTRLVRDLFEADTDIRNIASLNTYVTTVSDETFQYDTTAEQFELEYQPLGFVVDEERRVREGVSAYSLRYPAIDGVTPFTVIAIIDDEERELASTEFTKDIDDQGRIAGIILNDGVVPDAGTNISIDYRHSDFELTSVVDDDGFEYEVGVDVNLVNAVDTGMSGAIDFTVNNTVEPADGQRFSVSYVAKKSFPRDLVATERELQEANKGDVEVTEL